jgi:5-methylcytosine-specific restriction endonuclease McrA
MTTTQAKLNRNKHQPTGQWIRPDKRLAIYLRDRFTCLYCLRDLHDAAPMDVTLDHLVAKCDGGSNNEDNLVTCCRGCNCTRQDLPLKVFAGPETRQHIRRNTRRKLTAYRTLAKAILAGEIEYDRNLEM